MPSAAHAQGEAPAAPPAATTDPPATAAAGAFTWAVEPSGPEGPGNRDAFVFDAAPGDRLVDTVAISNLSFEPLTVSIYAADAFNTADGGFALRLEDAPQLGVGDWSSLATNIHTIEPRSRIDVPFEINIPDDAEPGDHAGAILATASDESGTPLQSEEVPGSNVTVDRRVGARVYLRVDGPLRPALQVTRIGLAYDSPATPLQRGATSVTYEVMNTGNVRLPVHTEVALGGPFGKKLGEGAPRDFPELLPGGTVTIAEPLGDVAPWMQLTAAVTASSGDLQVRRSGSTLALPWPTVLLVLAFVGFRVWRRRRRAARARPAVGPAVGADASGAPDRRGPADLVRRAGAAIAATKRPTG